MKIIDDTYNGEKYPIIEREYNAYYFPDNYNPDNMEDQSEGLVTSFKNHQRIEPYGPTKTK
ncbi:MAG: hypothetical protein ACOZCL_07280 [Bacillota bacterium]